MNVKQIRAMRREGKSMAEVAAHFGVDEATIRKRLGVRRAGYVQRDYKMLDRITKERKDKYSVRSVMECLDRFQHDEDFEATEQKDFEPCEHPAGSDEKIIELMRRAELGLPLYHPKDNPEVLPQRETDPYEIPLMDLTTDGRLIRGSVNKF